MGHALHCHDQPTPVLPLLPQPLQVLMYVFGSDVSLLDGREPLRAIKALRLAEPVDQTVLESIAFLRKVSAVRIVGGDKKQFALRVELRDTANESSSYTIQRSNIDVSKLQLEVMEICRAHPIMSQYNLPPCTLCDPLKILSDLPVSRFDRLTKSVEEIRAVVETRLNEIVRGAVVSPTNTEYYCEGLLLLPSTVTDFLLRDIAVQVSQ